MSGHISYEIYQICRFHSYPPGLGGGLLLQMTIALQIMGEPSKFGANLNSGYFKFFSFSLSVEVLE